MLHTIGSYLSSLLYHVWRAMRGRPQFVHLTDSRAVLLNFLCAYAVTSTALMLLRGQLGAMSVASWLAGLAVLWSCFGLGNTSKVLLGSVLAAMAGYDLVEVVAQLALDLPGAGVESLAPQAMALQSSAFLASGNALQLVLDGMLSRPDLDMKSSEAIVQQAGAFLGATVLEVAVGCARMLSILMVASHFKKMPDYIRAPGYRPE